MSYADRDKYGMYRDSNDAGPGPALMGADTLIGDSVVNGADENLGDIKEIMLDMNTGQVAYAVLAFGGFLGMGEKLFAVPWQAMHLDTVNKRFVLNVDKDRLKNAPGFNPDDWPDMSDVQWANQIHTFYGTDPNRVGGPTMGPSVPTGGMIGGAGTGAGMGAGMGSSMGAGSAGSTGVGAGTSGTGAAGSSLGSGVGSSTTGGGSLGSGIGGSTSVGSDSGLDTGTRTGSGDLDSTTRGPGGSRGDNI
ncbi:MAG: PRC-barrel domain-containing protein [Massilia sp.]